MRRRARISATSSLNGASERLYDRIYCASVSTAVILPKSTEVKNPQFALLEAILRIALAGGELANAYVGTIRLKLLKIGAVVLRKTQWVRLLLSGAFPRQALFRAAAAKLRPGGCKAGESGAATK